MKKLLLTLGIAIFTMTAFTQNNSVIIIDPNTDSILNGKTYTVYGDGATADVQKKFLSVMDSQDSMLVGITRYEKSTIANSFDYFCWYLCYGPVAATTLPVWQADDSLWMYKNDTIDDFAAYLQPKGNMGSACYQFVFYPADNPTDSSFMDVCFEINTVGINELNEEELSIFPNPVEDILNVKFDNNSNLLAEVYDVHGKLMFDFITRSGVNSIDVKAKGLNSGMYFIKFLDDKNGLVNKSFMVK